jgi:Tfp pilus assembly protein PilN
MTDLLLGALIGFAGGILIYLRRTSEIRRAVVALMAQNEALIAQNRSLKDAAAENERLTQALNVYRRIVASVRKMRAI